jgi:hypothetical protein
MAAEHDPEKWQPVFAKRSCSTKNLELQSISSETMVLWAVANGEAANSE